MEYALPEYLASKCSDVQIRMKRIENDFHLTKCFDFLFFLEDELYTDVTFYCSNSEKLQGHSAILATLSPMLGRWMMEQAQKVLQYSIFLPDVSAKDLKLLLHLLYGGKVTITDQSQLSILDSIRKQLSITISVLDLCYSPEVEELPLCCWRCGASFTDIRDLKTHVTQSHSGEKIRPTKRHKCTKCKKVLPSMWKLRQHLLTHTIYNANADHMYAEQNKQNRSSSDHPYANAPPPSAPTISESSSADHPYSFRTLTNPRGAAKRKASLHLQRTKKIKVIDSLHSYAATSDKQIENENEVQGEENDRKMTKKEAANTERNCRRSCRRESTFECPQCKKKFPQNYRLIRHVEEVHDQVKKFACGSCGKAFFKSSSLSRHALTHTDVSIYRCENCFKSFKDASGLKYHLTKGTCTAKANNNVMTNEPNKT